MGWAGSALEARKDAIGRVVRGAGPPGAGAGLAVCSLGPSFRSGEWRAGSARGDVDAAPEASAVERG